MKKILITGITGQDGPYMAEYRLKMDDCLVFGMARRTAQIHDKNYAHLKNDSRFKIVRGDLLDGSSIDSLVQEIKPDYFINFAAQSFVGDSWRIPEETFMATAVGALKCLEAVRKYAPLCRFYNAGSSEQFGEVEYAPQGESHPFRPLSPYGAAKCAAHHLVRVYRKSYNLYAIQGTLYNHESELRGEEFATRKITKGLSKIAKAIKDGKEFESLKLGNLDAIRDWSHASDFVIAIWMMLNQEQFSPALKDFETNGRDWLIKNIKEYVVASGECHTVREFVNIITRYLDYDCQWVGEGVNEKLVLNNNFTSHFNIKSNILIEVSPEFYRPADVQSLLGDSTAIRKDLGWKPKISFDELCKSMINWDLNESGIVLPTSGAG